MSITQQWAGTAVKTTVTFTNPGSITPVDPTTVTLKYRVGQAVATTWTYGGTGAVVKVGIGIYSATLDTTNGVGIWNVEWIGTGTCAAVSVGQFQIDAQPF
jgi:hypothetical protein